MLNESILLYMGDDLLTKSTKEFQEFFKTNWYPIIHEMYIHKFTIGFAPFVIMYREDLGNF